MALRIDMVTVDSADPRPLALWWAQALDARVVDEHDGWFVEVVPQAGAGGPVLAFQKVDDPTPGKNRLHLDLGASDREAEVAALVAAGATPVGEHSAPGYRWSVLADPQGNQFCVGAPDASATGVS